MSLSAATVQEIFQDIGLFVRTDNLYGSEVLDLIQAETVKKRTQLGSGDLRLDVLGRAIYQDNQNVASVGAMTDGEIQVVEQYILGHVKDVISAAGDSASEVLEDLAEQMVENCTPAQYVAENVLALGGSVAADSDNAGDGTLGSTGFSQYVPAQRFTVECVDATTPGAEQWSVTGSVSGALDTATTGVAYEDSTILLSFTIAAGGTAFAVGDRFYFYATCTERRFQTYFRDHWSVVMPSAGLGSETIEESWTR